MIRSLKNLLKFVVFTFLIYVFVTNSKLIVSCVNESTKLFISVLLPSLLPFFILADILINYDYLSFLEKIFKFKYSNIILLTLISGLPSNAKYISTLLSNNIIKKEDAEKLLSVTFFPNPMFCIFSVGVSLFNNYKIGLSFYIIVVISNLIMFISYYKSFYSNSISIKIDKQEFPILIKNSILKNIDSLLLILGTVVIFNILVSITDIYLNLNPFFNSLLNAFLEMTSGLKRLSTLKINTKFLYSLTTMTLSFSGVSVLMQALSMLTKYNLNIKFIIKNKIIISFISIVISTIYFSLF